MKHPSRIEFANYRGQHALGIAHGDHSIVLMPEPGSSLVFTDDEAEHLGWNLIRQARYSRKAAA